MGSTEYKTRYADHVHAFNACMREAQAHINSFEQMTLTPKEAIEAVDNIKKMLTEAQYHAERMGVYLNLLKPLPRVKKG